MENDARGRKFPAEGVYPAAEQRIVSELSQAQLTVVSTLGAQGPGHSKRRHGPRRDKQSGHELIIGVGYINH